MLLFASCCYLMCPVSADTLLPMQLQDVDLSYNELVGTLPESWSNLSNVSLRQTSVDLLLS